MAECLRSSSTAKFVLCYHSPDEMIGTYGFEMKFVAKQATKMRGVFVVFVVVVYCWERL
jgi:hypothetical protein